MIDPLANPFLNADALEASLIPGSRSAEPSDGAVLPFSSFWPLPLPGTAPGGAQGGNSLPLAGSGLPEGSPVAGSVAGEAALADPPGQSGADARTLRNHSEPWEQSPGFGAARTRTPAHSGNAVAPALRLLPLGGTGDRLAASAAASGPSPQNPLVGFDLAERLPAGGLRPGPLHSAGRAALDSIESPQVAWQRTPGETGTPALPGTGPAGAGGQEPGRLPAPDILAIRRAPPPALQLGLPVTPAGSGQDPLRVEPGAAQPGVLQAGDPAVDVFDLALRPDLTRWHGRLPGPAADAATGADRAELPARGAPGPDDSYVAQRVVTAERAPELAIRAGDTIASLSQGPVAAASENGQASLATGVASAGETSARGAEPLPRQAPPAQPTLPAIDLFGDELGPSLSDRLTVMSGNGLRRAELQINPEHLGPLRIEIDSNEDGTRVQFTAASALVREALEQALPRLRELFQQQGMTLSDVNVEGGDSESPQNRDAAAEERQSRRGWAAERERSESGADDEHAGYEIPARSRLVDTYV